MATRGTRRSIRVGLVGSCLVKGVLLGCTLLLILAQPGGAIDTRQQLIDIIFGGALPARQPDLIEPGVNYPDWQYAPNLARIDRLTINLEWGLTSVAYHFIPTIANNQLLIYHEGHQATFGDRRELIEAALSRGFAVVAFDTIMQGHNNRPDVVYKGRVWHLFDHGQLEYLTPAQGHPIRYFLDPVIISLNYLDDLGYTHISMAGLSGGAWVTTLVAALDERIENSYPVAGSQPLFLFDGLINRWGDWEPMTADIYSIADYDDLYVMGTTANRRQLQILMRYDPCCYSGLGWKRYYDEVRGRSEGRWDLFNDESIAAHDISAAAIERILGELEAFGAVERVWLPIVAAMKSPPVEARAGRLGQDRQ